MYGKMVHQYINVMCFVFGKSNLFAKLLHHAVQTDFRKTFSEQIIKQLIIFPFPATNYWGKNLYFCFVKIYNHYFYFIFTCFVRNRTFKFVISNGVQNKI